MVRPPLDPELLSLIRCPITREPLEVVAEGELAELNRRIEHGQVRNRTDQSVQTPLQAALISRSHQWIYPVYEHGPTLIGDEAIPGSAVQPAGDEPVPPGENRSSQS